VPHDDAIAANRAWNITYRFVHPDGRHKWVRERGSAVYVDGGLAYLQGMVVGAGTEYALRQQLHEQVEGTRTASAQIVDLTEQITSSVQELAMLSINARIEAARSGEAGKGFAVVANEIKMLADRNAGFAEMIADEVQGLNGPCQGRNDTGVKSQPASCGPALNLSPTLRERRASP